MTHEQNLYDLLILHNEDDLKGMPSILPILNMKTLDLNRPFAEIAQQLNEIAEGYFGKEMAVNE